AQRLSLPLDAMHELVHGIGERLMPIEGTLLLLEQLRQRRDSSDGVTGLYYLSNMPVPYARVLEQRFAFLRWFDGGVFSGDVKHIKPDPLIYQMLQERYQLPAAHTVFVDDLKANVHVAQSLGWRGIHFESPQQLQAELSLLGL
ncbi:MAG: HAD-IA family hydrolase, partial [Rhodoferax sp.]|nr:HAD-IA family hydrolase [Rhodoferax sp.]